MAIAYLMIGFFPPDASLMQYIIGTAVAGFLDGGAWSNLLELHEDRFLFALGTAIYSPIMFITRIISVVSTIILGMAVSRNREPLADSNGARIILDPHALASALEKISTYNNKRRGLGAIEIIKAKSEEGYTAYLCFNRLEISGAILNLPSTPPPIKKRIEILMSMR